MMMAFFNYLLEVSVCIIALYGVYHLIMQQEKLFNLNRFYLLSVLILSIIIPLIDIGMPVNASVYLKDYALTDGLISSTLSTPNVTKSLTINWSLIAGGIYLIGVGILFINFLKSCIQIFQLSRNGKRIKQAGYTLILVEKELPVFSFLQYVFLYKHHQYSEKELTVILTHEAAHISERHTIDILVSEFVKILLWFNPIMYLYQQKLKEVHEYLADQTVVNTKCSTVQYATLMMEEARKHTAHILPVTHFFHNQLKNRLVMLSKSKKPMRGLKTFLSLPVLLMLFVVFSVNGRLFSQVSDFPPNAEPGHCYAKCIVFDGPEPEWREVICPSKLTGSYLNSLTKQLRERGYIVGTGAVKIENPKPSISLATHKLDPITAAALTKFQEENKLATGRVSLESMKALGID